MDTILALFTCFNRKDKTRCAIEGLLAGNPGCSFTFVVVDDGSSDGTPEMLEAMNTDGRIRVLHGDGSLFYSGGMRMGMEAILANGWTDYDYFLMMNDDVVFHEGCIEKMIRQSREQQDAVIVGATCSTEGELSYSGIKYTRGIKYYQIPVGECNVEADTCNANCVLIPFRFFEKVGVMDGHYRHSLGDFDYGLELKNAGAKLRVSKEYVGICNDNPKQNTWHDRSLPRLQRLKKKESIKGDPVGPWFYYLRKHFGLPIAIKSSLTPFIRILLGL